MSIQPVIRPGRPDDDNRHYLPEELYRSDITVNENGNNSLPYPERLQEFHEDLTGVSAAITPGHWLRTVRG